VKAITYLELLPLRHKPSLCGDNFNFAFLLLLLLQPTLQPLVGFGLLRYSSPVTGLDGLEGE
jgi:hypothetical protein